MPRSRIGFWRLGAGASQWRPFASVASLLRNLFAVVDDSPLKPFVTNSVEPHVTLLRDRLRVPKVRNGSLSRSPGRCGALHWSAATRVNMNARPAGN
ncbi:hypothetical protein MES4922_230243 [Mesorhizobium ventifaucium]|uniref:Uncharacterized protein n=1 Tax=Mesorhizobium ventifaucium TaxID=666020 RepID=A0ABM9DUA3_9HYPH|nr:hypothetical protein MES4922_230243 [Mesorhizobium ventifaucium]